MATSSCSGAANTGPDMALVSRLRAVERHVGDAAGRGRGFDLVVLLQAFQPVPQSNAPAEHDRDDRDVQVVDEPCGEEVADDGRSAADTHVLALRARPGLLERLGGRGVEEVERGAALHLDRRAGTMGEDEGRRVERRVGTPPSRPLRVVLPSGRAELAGPHDLGADAGEEALSERVVDAAAPALLAQHLVAVTGGNHPHVKSMTRMTERGFQTLTLARGEAVE